jgi:hypothetical protein
VINVGSDALPQILDFFSTNKQAVILCIQGNPAELQLAHKYGFMHETLTSMTHYKGIPENMNITKVDLKTSTMWAMQGGRAIKSPLGTGIDQIMNNNRAIANNPAVKKYLTEDDSVDVLPIPDTHAAYLRQRRKIKLTAEAMGEFVSPIPANMPRHLPQPVPKDEHIVDMIVSELGELPDSSFESDGSLAIKQEFPDIVRCLRDPLRIACGDYAFGGKHWFESVGSGWRLCPDASKKIYSIIHRMQQETVARLSLRRQSSEAGSGKYNRLLSMSDSLSRLSAKVLADDYVTDAMC